MKRTRIEQFHPLNSRIGIIYKSNIAINFWKGLYYLNKTKQSKKSKATTTTTKS